MPPVSRTRDYRVDFWRGVALLTIFVNHVPGNVFEHLTHRNYGFSDAAELFVLLAGYASALAYFRRYEAGEVWLSSVKTWFRAAKLYIAHIVTVVIAIAIFAMGAMMTQDPKFLEAHGLGTIFSDPVKAMVGVATLGHQVGYFNILPMYMAFLLMMPVIMWLAARDLWLALAASCGLWLVVQFTGFNIPNWPLAGSWFFNPFAWQFLFTIGFVVSVLVMRRGVGVAYSRPLFWVAAAYLAVSFVWVSSGFAFDPETSPLPRILVDFDKADLSLNRLLHVLALAYVVAHLPLSRWMATHLSGDNPVVVIGRHSLIIFCLGSLMAALSQVVLYASGGGILVGVILIASGIFLHLLLGAAFEWYRLQTTRKPDAKAPASGSAPARVRVA